VSVRLVLAVILAAALLGAAMPVVDDARQDVAVADADRAAQNLADAMADLSRSSDPVPRGVPGGRRAVTVDLPQDASLVVGSTENGTTSTRSAGVVTARVPPSADRTTRISTSVRVVEGGRVQNPNRRLVLRDGARVRFRYVLVDGVPTVTVARV
jgi:hypothetical protein